MQLLPLYWQLLEQPLDLLQDVSGIRLPDMWRTVGKAVLTLILVYSAYILLRTLTNFLRQLLRKDRLVDRSQIDALLDRTGLAKETVEALQRFEVSVEPLKRAKDYAALGDLYSSVKRHKEAAKYYKKAGDGRKAAAALADAGQVLRAAKLLMKEGDLVTAAGYFTRKGKHTHAARAYETAGDYASAAGSYTEGGKPHLAAEAYKKYFAVTHDSIELQTAAASACHQMLESAAGRAKVSAEQRKALLPALATRFEQAERYETAARLFREAGDFARAGEVFVLANMLEEAAACMQQAGRREEAARIIGRCHSAKGHWKEAAVAYISVGEFLQAAECYSKAAETGRAAECFEKAGEFYRAAVAYAHAARHNDAIRVIQKIRESSPDFDRSRGLLGECFYELHDYAHAAAALENYLTGRRVDSTNADYFYMLALAYEQLGRLSDARDIFYKIRTVNVAYRDVAERIATVSSRISLQAQAAASGSGAGPQPDAAFQPAVSADAAAPQGLAQVQALLGGRYRLQRELGRGGMGVVYLAHDTQLDRPVALKFLGTLVDHSEEYRQRFIREARTGARISHPNVVSIYDISATEGKAYIAMEYVEGANLHRHLIKKGRLAPQEAIAIIGQACAALAAIHDAGITHRDIKPENILLTKSGMVKLTDFGLAKAQDARMTRTGVAMGTPSYMPPEQVLGKEADARSDIYSLGLVLHECLTGKTVFEGGDILERQLKEAPPRPSVLAVGIPAELDALVMKCIAKAPEQRYQNARELLADLRRLRK